MVNIKDDQKMRKPKTKICNESDKRVTKFLLSYLYTVPGDTPKLMQAAITVPAIVEKPLVRTVCNSDMVKSAKYG